jgi:hypothetical protein
MDDGRTMERFREMHDNARRGKISLEYRSLVESFLRAAVDVQNSGLATTLNRRTVARVPRVLQVDLSSPAGRSRSVTFDVGLGGFSVLLPREERPQGVVRFSLRLPRGLTAEGSARALGFQSRSGAARCSFAFEEIDDRRALEAYLIDELLTQLGPDARRAVVVEDWFVDLPGRALRAG